MRYTGIKKRAKPILIAVSLVIYIGLLVIVADRYITSNRQWEINIPEPEISARANQEIMAKALIKNKMYYEMSNESGHFLSYHVYDEFGDMLQFENPRTSIALIEPGNSKEIEIMLKAPSETGKYIVEIDMVKEGEFWYKDRGESPGVIYLTVY